MKVRIGVAAFNKMKLLEENYDPERTLFTNTVEQIRQNEKYSSATSCRF